MRKQISHDGFARQSLMRESVPNPDRNRGCTECGQHSRTLYRYGTESDGGTFYGYAKGEFCGVSCFRSYHS